MKLNLVSNDSRNAYLKYLLLADECEDIINEYINSGEMYSMRMGLVPLFQVSCAPPSPKRKPEFHY